MAQNAPMEYKTVYDAAALVARAFEVEADDSLIDAARAFSTDPVQGMEADAQKLVDRGARQLGEALKEYNESDDKALWRDYLDASFAGLFLGVALQSIAPQESVYCNRDKLMYEKQYFETVELMRRWGFVKPDDVSEPEDHIACEWLFLLFLVDMQRAAREAGNSAAELQAKKAAAEFKAQHMDTWMELAYKDMLEADDMGFYSGIVNIARGVQKVL